MTKDNPLFLNSTILCLLLIIFHGYRIPAQHSYDVSWKAGILGINQNPAAIATAPYQFGLTLASLDLSAENNLFQSNNFRAFAPTLLIRNLSSKPGSMAFTTNINNNSFAPNNVKSWSAINQSHGQVLGLYFQLKDNPDLFERGLVRRVLSIRLERNELFQIKDLSTGQKINRFI